MDVLKKIPHWHFVFSIPKILRRYFLYDRKLLADLSRCAWESLKVFPQNAVPEKEPVPGTVIAANAMGLPMPYDVGTQRHCWQIHLLTNWMGDEGWLKKSRAEYRKFVYLSDVVRITGRVSNKYVDEEGERCVDIETHAFNQREEDAMPGTATVVLPSKSDPEERWPVSRRL